LPFALALLTAEMTCNGWLLQMREAATEEIKENKT